MKLPNGFGSVYKLSGKRRNPWCARKTIGWKTLYDKKRRDPIYYFVGFFPSKKEALQALATYNERLNNQEVVTNLVNTTSDSTDTSLTFADVYEKWADTHFKKIKDGSHYKTAYKLCDMLKDVPIKDIKLEHLQKVVDISGKNTPSLKNLKILFGLVYDYAVKHEIVPPNKREIVRYLDIDNKGTPRAITRAAFSKDNIDRLWAALDTNPCASIALILIYTGVRIGELLNLKKKDIHLEERWFYVEAAKTEAGIREVPIADKIVPLFEFWLSKASAFLICSPRGYPLQYPSFHKYYWKPLILQLDLRYAVRDKGGDIKYEFHRPHDTRHTCVSLLTEKNVDERIIKQIVGHKGSGITQAVYTHLTLATKIEAINKI